MNIDESNYLEGYKHYCELFSEEPMFNWQNEIVQNPKNLEDFEYYKGSGKFEENILVNLDDIIGTHHIDYQGKKWIEMLGCLKHGHQKSSIDSEKWISKLNTIQLSMYNGKFYVSGDGDRRVCYAKFSGHKKLKIRYVTVFELDKKHINYRDKIIQLNLKINSWSSQRYEIKMGIFELVIETKNLDKFIYLFCHSKLSFLDKLKLKFLVNYEDKKHYWLSLSDKKELKKITQLIAIHKSMIN